MLIFRGVNNSRAPFFHHRRFSVVDGGPNREELLHVDEDVLGIGFQRGYPRNCLYSDT